LRRSPLYLDHVAYAPRRLHPAVSPHQGRYTARWRCVAHEIKHDGFRIIARKNGPRVRLYSRPGNDLTGRFPLIVETLANLRTRSCIIDGEAVCCDDDGRPSFDRLRALVAAHFQATAHRCQQAILRLAPPRLDASYSQGEFYTQG
jgi:ATP-dependent DNA ligase